MTTSEMLPAFFSLMRWSTKYWPRLPTPASAMVLMPDMMCEDYAVEWDERVCWFVLC